MPSKKKTYVKNLEQLEEAIASQDGHTEIEAVEEAAGVQQMSPESMAKFRRSIRDTNQILYREMLENIDRVIFGITTKLRKNESATEDFSDAEDAMYNMEMFVSRHRYTIRAAEIAYVDRDVKLHLLSEINLLMESGQYPLGADGKARALTPMQQSALWY